MQYATASADPRPLLEIPRMDITTLLDRLANDPQRIEFQEVMATLDTHYRYTPTLFTNGIGEHKLVNEPGKNEGSCKVFAFGLLHHLDETTTLACFGQHYRDVLAHPHGSDHANIRRFMQFGWNGICFDGQALEPR